MFSAFILVEVAIFYCGVGAKFLSCMLVLVCVKKDFQLMTNAQLHLQKRRLDK